MEFTTANVKRITLLVALLPLASSATMASQWTCEQAGLVREVTVYFPTPSATLPCEVFYTKPSEQALPKRLWSAINEEGYCERKAAEFVDALRGLGWQCEISSQAPDSAEDDQTQGS